MNGPMPAPDATIRPEPRGVNLLDLVLIIAGFGLYWILPSFGYQPNRVPWFQAIHDVNWWYEVSATLVEMMERAGLVLAMVAFARRVRLGGVARPGEFLFAFVAMHWILIPSAGSWWVLALRSPTGVGVALIALGVSALIFGRWRRRLLGWIATVLIAVAYFSMICILAGLNEFADQLAYAFGRSLAWQMAWQFALQFAIGFPYSVMFAAPYAAALWDAREASRRWSSFEWGGIILAVAWFLINQGHSLVSALVSTPRWYFLASLFLSWALDLVGLVVGLWLARRLAPAVRAWFAPA